MNGPDEGENGMGLELPSHNNKRILLVEDDRRIINFMQRGLEAEGITLDVVSAKTPALHLTESRRYNTIILDIYLGDEDGLDTAGPSGSARSILRSSS
jgi:CheY-like chemotaxis protein